MWPRIISQPSNLQEILDSSYIASQKWKCLNSFISEFWPEANAQVKALEIKKCMSKGNPLFGMPLAVKDNFCVKGTKTSCGSKMLDNFVAPYTSTVVQKLLDQGMVLVAKTNMDSFAMGSGSLDGIHGPVKNPWTWVSRRKTDPQSNHVNTESDLPDFRIAGGSSGGSAAAVSAGIVYGSLGSDTGGSVRIPASYCGVVGLKPSYGLLSRHGLIALVNSLDCPGIITQNVQQCTNMLNAIAGHDSRDSTTYHTTKYKPIELQNNFSVRGLKVGIPLEYHAPGTTNDVLNVWENIASELSKAGAVIQSVSLPHTQYSISCYSVLNYCEVASNMARYDGIEYGYRGIEETSTEALYAQSRHESLTDVVRGRIFAGNYFLLRKNYEEYYVKAAQVRRKICDDFHKVFNEVDILLTPTVISDAPLYSQFKSLDNRTQCAVQDVYTQPSNLAGIPAVSVPVGLSGNYLPLSVQLICRQFDEERLLNTAHWIENLVDFPHIDSEK